MQKKSVRILIAAIVTAVVACLYFYVTLPALNVFSEAFWIFITLMAICFGVVYVLLSVRAGYVNLKNGKKSRNIFGFEGAIVVKIVAAVAAIPVIVVVVGNIISSTFFNAQAYSEIITVSEAVFEDDMPETDVVSNIALMDTQTAQKLGDRTLGALSNVVSQYEISPNYKQINYKQTPQKISNLEYADFFKWLSNKDKGIPGYVMVDPVNVTDAKYIELEKPMKYADSAFFGEDLHRALRMKYPTKIFGSYSFEIDDAGNPHYIVSCMKPKIMLFGALDVEEVIVFNPVDGSSELYELGSVPSWVDNVFTGELASQKYDWYGTLKNGFWNSVIGNKDCKVTTDDFGYIVIEDDVWFFTGVTSVTSDESNIGFIISNARTGEYKFYSVIGAEEYSAMAAAEGEVQEKRYVASFPSLINVAGEATYIMVLKDDAGLVKLYALVNVEKYTIVATGESQTEAKQAYIEKLKKDGDIVIEDDTPDVEAKKATVTVSDMRFVNVSGESVLYVTGSDGYLYKQTVAKDERVMLIALGDKLEIEYAESQIGEIRQIIAWKIIPAADGTVSE
ncbi:MAG: hypothetical protein E7642_01390 [Ruminococcaceae bacterium]|nr:hypothetical protein [Oscillospiraceae bacterium]